MGGLPMKQVKMKIFNPAQSKTLPDLEMNKPIMQSKLFIVPSPAIPRPRKICWIKSVSFWVKSHRTAIFFKLCWKIRAGFMTMTRFWKWRSATAKLSNTKTYSTFTKNFAVIWHLWTRRSAPSSRSTYLLKSQKAMDRCPTACFSRVNL